ncbi:MAG: IS4 family transposase [Candidatus Falkowbacteria bacterium]
MIKTKSVNSSDIATVLNPCAKKESNQRRIENFLANQEISYEIVAALILAILPTKKYKISIDRTNWKYGKKDINIFMLCINYMGIGIPVYWTCLEKRGNSNTAERIELLDAFISLFGQKRIKYLLADREFVGEEWFKYLKRRKIPFYIRVRENFYLHDFDAKIRVNFFFDRPKPSVYRGGKICGVKLNVVGRRLSKTERKEENEELLIVVTNEPVSDPAETLKMYKERWVVETLFRAYKRKGFNLEATHITDPERIRKLVAMLSLALVWCYKMGIKYDACYEPIEVKKHGYKQYSYVKYGLDLLRNILSSLPLKNTEFSNAVILFSMIGFENSLSTLIESSA